MIKKIFNCGPIPFRSKSLKEWAKHSYISSQERDLQKLKEKLDLIQARLEMEYVTKELLVEENETFQNYKIPYIIEIQMVLKVS
jgi:hypothetical protein